MSACTSCKNSITEQESIALSSGALFHKSCFKCSKCSGPLSIENPIFTDENNEMICSACGEVCSNCGGLLGDEPIVAIESGKTFHKSCFKWFILIVT